MSRRHERICAVLETCSADLCGARIPAQVYREVPAKNVAIPDGFGATALRLVETAGSVAAGRRGGDLYVRGIH